MTRAERRREAREKLKRMSKEQRKAGGQPGHEGKHRQMAAPDRVDRYSEHLPEACGCGHRFDGSETRVRDSVIHQRWELPPVRPLVFRYDLVRLRCPCCGRPTLADLPAGVSWSPFAPRLEAHIATLAGVYRLSRRQVRDVIVEMFGVPISLGAVDAVIMRMSEVLKDPWEQLRASIQQARQVHADETGWRLKGAYECLWVASTALAACYRIDAHRSQAAAKELLGEEFGGFVISDRYVGYHWLDVLQQQLCWAHWIRSLIALSERPGAPGRLGKKLLKAAREAIHIHHAYLEREHDLDWLREQLEPLRTKIQALLEQGTRGHDQKTANYCAGLLEEYDAPSVCCAPTGRRPPAIRTLHSRARAPRTREHRRLEQLLRQPDGMVDVLGVIGGARLAELGREHPELLEKMRARLSGVAQARRAPQPDKRWAIADSYAGIEHARLVVVNIRIRHDGQRQAAEQLVADIVRLRQDNDLLADILGPPGSRIPITAVAANMADPEDPARKKALARVRRAIRSASS